MAKLIVKEGPSRVMEYELTDSEVKVVGRDRSNDIRINHALVSRNHAQFFKHQSSYAVRDLESKNGTFVNDTLLTPGVARPLTEGDQVRIGPTTFVFTTEALGIPGLPAGAGAEEDLPPIPSAPIVPGVPGMPGAPVVPPAPIVPGVPGMPTALPAAVGVPPATIVPPVVVPPPSGAAPAPVATAPVPMREDAPAGAAPATRLIDLKNPLFEPGKANQLDELRAVQAQLMILLEFSKQMAGCADPRAVHQALLTAVQEHIGPQRAFLFRMSENNAALLKAGQYLAAGEAEGQPLQAARLAVAQAIRDKSGVIRTGLMTAEQTGSNAETRQQLAAPIIFNNALLGVIYTDAREQVRPLRVGDLRLLVGLAQHTADTLGRLATAGTARTATAGFTNTAIEHMRREAALLGASPAINMLRSFAAKVAATNEPVLLWGPPGTGKQHLARLIHLMGPRAGGPFVVISGPALPKSTTESEIFGIENEGMPPQTGKLEWADGGTLFIDQLQEISLAAQERLFTLVSRGEFQRVNAEDTRKADVRVIISTNADPKEFVGQRLFSAQLLQMLGQCLLEVPALTSRREDIPALAEHFLQRCRTKANRKLRGFADDALSAIQAYNWPGNIEELHLAIHLAVYRGDGREIRLSDLPESLLRSVSANGRSGSVGSGSVGAGPLGAGSVGAGSVGAGPLGAGSVGAGPLGAGSVGAGSAVMTPMADTGAAG